MKRSNRGKTLSRTKRVARGAPPAPRAPADSRRWTLNLRVLASSAIALALLAPGAYALHGYQVRRNAAALEFSLEAVDVPGEVRFVGGAPVVTGSTWGDGEPQRHRASGGRSIGHAMEREHGDWQAERHQELDFRGA